MDRIKGQRRRLWRRNDRTQSLVIMTEISEEGDDPKESETKTEVSV